LTAHRITAPRFVRGWRLRVSRLLFALRCLRYLRDRKDFPLFRLSGLVSTLRVVRTLRLHKQVRFDGAYYSSLLIPHYPSAAFDQMVANGGLNTDAAGTPERLQIDTVILGVSSQCPLRCRHCYERHNLLDHDRIPVSEWRRVIAQVQNIGASIVVLSGGEPMLRYTDVLQLVASGDKKRSDFHLHTSGYGVTVERIAELRGAGLTAVAVGLDDVDPARHDQVRGPGAFDAATAALRACAEAGVLTYVNACIQPALIRSGDLWRYLEFVARLNVAFVQLLEPRPCGAFLAAGDAGLLTIADRARVAEFFVAANSRRRYRHLPVVIYPADSERPEHLGCRMAGLSHLYVDSAGNVNPCVFLPVTFGNILTEDLAPILARMRGAVPAPVYGDCPSLKLATTLRERAIGSAMPTPYVELEQEWEAALHERNS
jgi:MoaA/NifB/PqqE/SkfB family radical SAM enzyme